MEKVFVSINPDGQITVRPLELHEGNQDRLASIDLTTSTQMNATVLDSRGRLKLPKSIREYLGREIEEG